VLEALDELAPIVVEVADGVESGVRPADGPLVGPATANGEGEDDGGLAVAWGWLWLTQPEIPPIQRSAPPREQHCVQYVPWFLSTT